MATLQKITPNLWFNGKGEEAADFYISIFKNSSKQKVTYYTAEGQEIHRKPEGAVMTVEFMLEGQAFVALNGGPEFKFTEAISFIINCDSQQEVDYYWEKLKEGGDPNSQQCGWLKDKFGLSWQVVPTILSELISDPDNEKARRTMRAMLQMKKLDIAELQRAHDGK